MKLPQLGYTWYAAGIVALDLLLFSMTNAASVPSFIVMLGFILVVATLWVALYGVCNFFALYGVKLPHKKQVTLYLSLLISAIVAMQSVGQLSQRDLSVLIPLVVLGYGYSVYAKSSQRNLEN